MSRPYRFLFLDFSDVVVREQSVPALDDLEALAEAERRCQDHKIEVWQGVRQVATVKCHNAPLVEGDRHSL
jgi:hypothetical protein